MSQRIFTLICLFLLALTSVSAETMTGGVTKSGASNVVVDSATGQPVAGAKVSLPKKNYSTFTGADGTFDLGIKIEGNTLLAVEKDGYKPYSLTVNDSIAMNPVVLGVERSNPKDIALAMELLHLGDDKFSPNSANSGQFQGRSVGPFFTKTFDMPADAATRVNYFVIGSVIGLDTKLARSMGQNKIINSFSSPMEVYFNGNMIAEVHLNGDNQRIKIPNALIQPGRNEITVKTGKNLMQTAYADYDDLELMNLSIQSE